MTTTSNHIDEIFWEASRLSPGDQRARFLDRACGEDRELRQRLEKLLRVQPKVEAFLERPFAGPAPDLEPPAVCEGPGSVLGQYKLLEQIGEGGMGLVFMAEQLRPVRRPVALKILKPGMDTRQVVARFEAERQALALMDHPHIARVFDAGVTESGRPYFVMELVRGVAITEFCDQRRLSTRQRLELFVRVCQAVQHAHQKGIIHRDLKPSNVLVTLHDAVAVPKVIDFGIAKAVGQSLTEETLFTHFAQLVGTPLYMSPEQAEMNGLDVDTRSDVYALGAMLYELLTGMTPFEGEALRGAGPDEMRRIIREQEPLPPSRRVSTLDAQACSTVSERRGVDDRRLCQLLRGELDWVVMKALEKDRDRRYESASALAADVLRYLNDETVEACPPTAGYRLRKFLRRNWRVFVTASIITSTLVAATAVSAWQAIKARNAENRAAAEASVARAVTNFLQTDLLERAHTAPPAGREIEGDPDLTVREALDRAAARIDQRFQDQPLVEAAIRSAIGAAYGNLQSHHVAVSHLERAVALRQAHLGPDHPDTVVSMDGLAGTYSAAGRHPHAIALRERILETQKARLGPDDPATLASVCGLAHAHWFAGQLATSMPLLEQVLEKRLAIGGPSHADTLATMHALAMQYTDADRFADSMALYEKLLGLQKPTSGSEPQPTWWLLTYGQACQRAGKLDQADRLLRDALEQLRQQKDSWARRNSTANALGFLALNLWLQQRYDAAEPFAREAVAMNRASDIKYSYWVSVLGAILLGQRKYAEAEPLLLRGYKGMKEREGVHPAVRRRTAEVGGWVVRLYEASNQPEKARAWREMVQPKQAAVAAEERRP